MTVRSQIKCKIDQPSHNEAVGKIKMSRNMKEICCTIIYAMLQLRHYGKIQTHRQFTRAVHDR
jgi:hypothetical protein